MSRTITVEHNGNEYSGIVGTIKSTSLGYMDHGVLSAWIVVEWPGGGVSVGGYCLDKPKDRETRDYTRIGTAYGLDQIIRIIETVGVEKWEALPGRHVIVLFEGEFHLGSRAVGIAHATDDRMVLILTEHAESWREAASSA